MLVTMLPLMFVACNDNENDEKQPKHQIVGLWELEKAYIEEDDRWWYAKDDISDMYQLEVKKEGYWPHSESIYVSETDTLKDLRGIVMKKTVPLTIRYDEPNLMISLYAKGDSLRRDYAGVTPSRSKDTTLYVPYGKYDLKLSRRFEPITERRTAYEGRINFTESRNDFKVQTWSKNNFLLIGVDYNLTSGDLTDSGKLPVFGYAYFGQFKICEGLSTDILKASLFRTSQLNGKFEDIIGNPQAIASTTALQQPSWSVGKTNASAALRYRGTSS